MAVEVGSAFISIRPSMVGFHREVERDLRGMRPRLVRIGEEWGKSLQQGIRAGLEPVEVRLDTGQTARQLVTLNRNLDKLDGRAVKIDIDVNVSGAIAELETLGRVVDHLNGQRIRINADVDRGVGGLNRVAGAAGAAAGGMQGLGSAAVLMKGGLAVAAGPQLAAVSAGIIGLIGPLAAAGAGFAGLAAVAAPSLKRISDGAKDLTPVEKELKAGLDSTKDAFTGWQRALQPKVLPIFTKALGIVPPILKALTPITIGAADAVGGLVDRLKAGLQSPFFRMFAKDLATWVRPAITQLGGIIGNLLKAFAGIAHAFAPIGFAFLAVLSRMTAAFARFATGLADSAGFQRFATAMIGVLDNIASGWRMLLPLVAPILGQLLGLLFKVGLTLQAAFRPLAAGLLPVLGLLVGAVGRVVVALLPLVVAVGRFIGSLGTGLLPVLRPVVTAISAVARQIAGQLVVAFQKSVPSLQRMATAIGSLLPELLPLVGVWGRWVGTILSAVPAVVSIAATLVGYLVPVVRVVLQILVKVYTTVAGLVIPVFQRVVSVIQWAATMITPVFHAIWVGLQAVGAGALWVWNNAIKPAFTFIAQLAKWLFAVVAVVVLAPLVIAFKVVSAIVMALWTSAVKPAFSAIGRFIKATWTGVIRPVLSAVGTFLRGTLGPVFHWVYGSIIKPTWSAVGSLIRTVWTSTVRPVFDGIKSAVGKVAGAFRTAVSAIGKAWDGLKSAARKPVAYVVDVVFNKGIVKIWNSVAGLVPGVGKLDTIHFARGGIMPGYAPGRDSLLAAVSPGEAWMRPEWTRAVGPGLINLWNDIARRQGPSGVRKWFTGSDAMGGEGVNFARGGTVPRFAGAFGLGGIVGGFLKGAKDFFAGGLVKTARAAFGPLLTMAENAIGGTGFGRLSVGLARGVVDRVLGFFKPIEAKLGKGTARGLAWARTQEGKPYVWGGVGPGGYDCSGWISALTNVIKGRSPYSRLFTTFSFTGAEDGPQGFVRGLGSQFRVGVTNAGVGHMAGTLRGVNVESSGSAGVRVGGAARGADNGLFGMQYGLKFDSGGWLPPGISTVANFTGRPEAVLTAAQMAALADGSSGGSVEYHAHLDGMTKAAYEQQVRAAFTAMQVTAAQRDRTGRRR